MRWWPQTNGEAERFIRTLHEECACAKAFLSDDERFAARDELLRLCDHRRHSTFIRSRQRAEWINPVPIHRERVVLEELSRVTAKPW